MLQTLSRSAPTNNIYFGIQTMLAYDYPRVDKIKLVSGSNYSFLMTNNRLLNGFLFRQIFIVVCLHQRISPQPFLRLVKSQLLPDQQPNYRN